MLRKRDYSEEICNSEDEEIRLFNYSRRALEPNYSSYGVLTVVLLSTLNVRVTAIAGAPPA